MPQPPALDYTSNVYLSIILSPSSPYTSPSNRITLSSYPSIADIGQVGEMSDVKLLSVPKDIWSEKNEDILSALYKLGEVGNGSDGKSTNVLRVDVQEPEMRVKRGGDEL